MRLRTTLAVVLAFGAAACGSSSHPSTTRSTPSVGTSPTAPQSTTTAQASKPKTTTTTTGVQTLTAPPPVPASTPPAPDGLRQTTGYGTYELCSTSCSGSVPSSLRRQVHLPAVGAGGSCPVSVGSGPLKLQGSATQLPLTHFIGSSWEGARTTWQSLGYSGPILIRGYQIGGPHAVGFGEGHVPYDELQLLGSAMGAPPGQWPSFTRVRSPGCYAYVVTGTSFTEVIVFRAS